MSDDELLARFNSCTLDAFRHADHVRVAFLYLQRHNAIEAIERFRTGLLRFAAAQGKPGLYHETVTWAYLLLIQERMARAERQQTWPEFAAANPDLIGRNGNILKQYYRDGTLNSDLAKRTFVLPDRVVDAGTE